MLTRNALRDEGETMQDKQKQDKQKFMTRRTGKTQSVVLHGGAAHRDDFLCACFAAALLRCPIVRRDAQPKDLESELFLVLDVGQRFDPELDNFDHHQEDLRVSEECALSLWARYTNFWPAPTETEKCEEMNLYEVLEGFSWFQTTVDVDANGPFQVSKKMGIDTETFFALGSPIEKTLLSIFGQTTYLSPVGDPLYRVLIEIGEEMLSHAVAVKIGVDKLRKAQTTLELPGLSLDIFETGDIEGLRALRKAEGLTGGVCAWHDDRGPGWALFRQDDDPLVNFALCSGDPQVSFAHPKGFVLKTAERCSHKDLMRLVLKAMDK